MIEKKKLLVVDDSIENIALVIGALKHNYTIIVATNGPDAILLAKKQTPHLILLDVMMPGMNGYTVCSELKSDPACRDIPIIFLTAMGDENDEEKGLQIGAVDYITKPFSPRLLEQRVKNHVALKEHSDTLEDMVGNRTQMLNLTQDVTIDIAGNIAEYRDPETGEHIKRTKNFVKCLALALRESVNGPDLLLDDIYIELLFKSAPLHDIGKVGVSDSVLLKPGKLTPDEFEKMKLHTIYGKNIIQSSAESLGSGSFLTIALDIANTHHEKWDGSGYPQGLKGNEIPLSGRLMALADVYDALISKRVYKPAFSHDKAVRIIQESRGSHFDPMIVDCFLTIQDQFQRIAAAYTDPDESSPALSAAG